MVFMKTRFHAVCAIQYVYPKVYIFIIYKAFELDLEALIVIGYPRILVHETDIGERLGHIQVVGAAKNWT